MEIPDRVRLGYERFNRRDWETIARGLPDHFEAVDHLDERRAVGPNALKEVTTANGDTAFAQLLMEPMEILTVAVSAERVLAVVRVAAMGSGENSGISISGEVGQIWTFEHGIPVRFEQFRTWEETRRVAGADGR